MRFSRATPNVEPRLPMKSSATSLVWITKASSNDGRTISISTGSEKSQTMCSRISRSEQKFSARKMMQTGIGSRMYGIVEWMHAPVMPLICPGLRRRTCIADAGRDASLDDLISATCEYLEGCFLEKT